MTEFHRQLIDELILRPRTAQQLARDMSVDVETVYAALADLALSNDVVPLDGHCAGDAVCTNCGTQLESAEPNERCGVGFGGACEGWPIDVCIWRYCGGPISKALEAA
jgi:hypothetical protein